MRLLTALALASAAFPAWAADLPRPESVLGFRIGEDRALADWDQIAGYLRRLAAASGRIRVDEVGRTTEGRPFLVVTITSEANMARLEEIRRDNLRLADPRGLADEEARRLVARGKAVVVLNHGIHSTEVGSSLSSLELAHRLASSQDAAVLEVLDDTVILMLPSQNPDGTQKVAQWYRRTLGTPFEGGDIPFLYHTYAGHDINRDWYMFTQEETRLVVAHVYERWRPQIVHDLHLMGSRGARFFAPPYLDPWEPNVDPALRTAAGALGMYVAAQLTAQGKKGVVVHALYDAWSPARAYPFSHGGVRILTECASARLASPVEVAWEDLEDGIGYDPRRPSWNFPDPWPGGTWRLRDIVDYQVSASLALLEHAARSREPWLRNFLEVNRRACRRREPFAFVLPAEQADPLAAGRLLAVLRTAGVEVHRARAAFETSGAPFAAGSQVILMAQPASAFAKALLERQQYPDVRLYPGGPPQPPYDVTAHTLPLLLGVEVRAVAAPFAADLEPIGVARVAPGRVEAGGRFLALGHKNGDLVALGRLLARGVPVRWSLERFTEGGRSFPAGTLLVPARARDALAPLAAELGVTARAVDASPRALLVKRPRVGLYQSWKAPIDEGWTRYVFEKEAGVAYRTLHDADVRAGHLTRDFDVVVLPDQDPQAIQNGFARGTVPDEYTGGLGPEGVASLGAFVKKGGTLVALNAATEIAIRELGLPLVNALAGPGGEGLDCPGAILRVAVEGASPLAHGLEDPSIVWFQNSPAFEVSAGRAIARYVEESPLLSGWLQGGARLKGKAALVEVPLGRGRVVLFGFRPQYRAQSWATYIPLLNAIYTSASAAR